MSVLASSPFVFPLGEPAKSLSAGHAIHPIAIQIPAEALAYLASFNAAQSDDDELQTPPLEPSSPCSSIASSPRFESYMESVESERRRRSRDFFFPNMHQFESAAPVVTRASDLSVSDKDSQVGWAEHQRRRTRQFFFPNMETVESATPVVTRASDLKLSVETQQPVKTEQPKRRRPRDFFPSVETFESAVPVVTRAADLNLADHSCTWGEHQRRCTREHFFPSLKTFESAVPTVTRASDLKVSSGGHGGVSGNAANETVNSNGNNNGSKYRRPSWGEQYHRRRASQEFFFPNQKMFESAVPVVTRASDLDLGHEHRQHWQKQAEIDRMYHADSLTTVDGRRMFRLL